MAAPLHTVVIQSDIPNNGVNVFRGETFEYIVDVELPDALWFCEPHYARLTHYLSFEKNDVPFLVFTDFTQAQPVDNQLRSFLGVTDSTAINEPVPLAASGTYLPKFLRLRLVAAPGHNKKTLPEPKFVLILSIAPESYVYGTASKTTV